MNLSLNSITHLWCSLKISNGRVFMDINYELMDRLATGYYLNDHIVANKHLEKFLEQTLRQSYDNLRSIIADSDDFSFGHY